MAIIQASCSYGDLQLVHSRRLRPPPPSFSSSSSFLSTSCNNNPILPRPLLTQSLSLNLNSPHLRHHRFLTSSCQCLPDDADAAGSEVKDDSPPLPLEVLKKALDVSYGLKGTCIYLFGINNSVKTSMGKLLAEAFRYYYFDSDSLVVEAAGGESAARLYRETDEAGFRETETEVLRQLSAMGRLVVSAGDGSVQSTTNLGLMKHGISLWIDVPLDMVAKEVVEDGLQLPLSDIPISGTQSEVLDQLRKIYKKMQAKYATADATISLLRVAGKLGYDDIHAVTREDMGLQVLIEMEKMMRVKKMMEDAAQPF